MVWGPLKHPMKVQRLVRTEAAPGSILISDFNGDGFLDIVTANTGSGDISLLTAP